MTHFQLSDFNNFWLFGKECTRFANKFLQFFCIQPDKRNLHNVSFSFQVNKNGGQNIFEKIRTFSEQICTIRTFFWKKFLQSVQFLKKSVQIVHLRKIKPFLKTHTSKFNFSFIIRWAVITLLLNQSVKNYLHTYIYK